MSYKVLWDKEALADLKSLDKTEAKKIVGKVDNYLSQDPLRLGKPLSKSFKSLYRYRYGDYRVIYEVYKESISIVVVRVGHRSKVYKNI